MRAARAVGLGLLLAFLFWPEIPRYRAERQLGAASAAFEYVLDRPTDLKGIPAILDRITDAAIAAASGLPGDSRAWALAGSCQLVNRNADRALDLYREALAIEERAEIHLNVGRAHELAEKRFAAEASFLRAVWISPALLSAVPKEFAPGTEAELHRMEEELSAGRLAAPPARAD
jgi:tetratricopeptide (TPR) repeat protein